MEGEKPRPELETEEISLQELQEFLNSPELDLPPKRRNVSSPENVRWLLRNIWIRNAVPERYLEALKKLAKGA